MRDLRPSQYPIATRAFRVAESVAIVCTLSLAGFLRLYRLGESPPGMNVDEGAAAWNAFCLLKTGADQHGVSWPVFDSAGFGQGLTTLWLYVLMPFQAIGGLSVLTTRIAAALIGVLVVFLMYVAGKRLFNTWTGITAALLLSINPWHLQQSRWGHMATLFPLLAILPIITMLWANLPLYRDVQGRKPYVFRSAIAGIITGLSCYGYYAARLWVPVFLVGSVLVNWREWRDRVQSLRGTYSVAAFVFALALTFGPLIWATTNLPLLQKRAAAMWVWDPGDSLGLKVQKVIARYPGHFGIDFLFLKGDVDIALSPPNGYGLFQWYSLPMMALGLLQLMSKVRVIPSMKLLLVWIVLFPSADLLSRHPSMHALRSLPGVCPLTLLSAVGIVYTAQGLWVRRKTLTILAVVLTTAITFFMSSRFFRAYYQHFNTDPAKYYAGHKDILDACTWVKPLVEKEDAVFVTSTGIPHPYIYTLIGLEYDPLQWLSDPKVFIDGPLRDGSYTSEQVCLRYGKMYFMYGDFGLSYYRALLKNGRPDRALIIARPGEFSGGNFLPIHQILDNEGSPSLLIYQVILQ